MATYTLPITTTGENGAAVGSAQTPVAVRGFVDLVKVDYSATAPATTDLTLVELASDGTTTLQTILSLADTATDTTKYPEHAKHDATGTDDGQKTEYFVDGILKVSLAGCNALAPAAVVTLRVIEVENAF